MPVFLAGILIAVVLFYLFQHTGDISLKRTLKRWVGYAALAVLAWAVFGFMLVRFFPIVVCGMVIFMASRWLLHRPPEQSQPVELPAEPVMQSSRFPGYRMQKIRMRHLHHRGRLT